MFKKKSEPIVKPIVEPKEKSDKERCIEYCKKHNLTLVLEVDEDTGERRLAITGDNINHKTTWHDYKNYEWYLAWDFLKKQRLGVKSLVLVKENYYVDF
jgi:hypothetical protein